MLARNVLSFALMLIVVVLATCTASVARTGGATDDGMTLVVVPETDNPLAPLDPRYIVRLPLERWEPLTMRARAFLFIDGSLVGDVTSLCEWTTDQPDATPKLAPGRFSHQPWANFTISARYMNAVGAMGVAGGDLASFTGAVDPMNGLPIRATFEPPEDVTNKVLEGLDHHALEGNLLAGTLGGIIRGAGVRIVIDSTRVPGGPVLDADTAAAAFPINKAKEYGAAGYTSGPSSIVVSPQLGQALKDGDFSRVDADGLLQMSVALRVIGHEMLHVVSLEIHAGDADVDAPGTPNPFAGVGHDFEMMIVDSFAAITENAVPTTLQQKWNLRVRLTRMQQWYRMYYLDQPGDTPEILALKAQIRKIMDAIGLYARDGNGLPDIIDEWLRRHNINPNNLPTTNPNEGPTSPPPNPPSSPPDNGPPSPPNNPDGPPTQNPE